MRGLTSVVGGAMCVCPVMLMWWFGVLVYEGSRSALITHTTPSGRTFATVAHQIQLGDTPDGIRQKMRRWQSVHPYFWNAWATYDMRNDESDRHSLLSGPTGWDNRVCDGGGKMVFMMDGEQRDPSIVVEFAEHRVVSVRQHNNFFVF